MLSHPEFFEKLMDMRNANDKTINRRMHVKNSYMTIFPNYGLYSGDYVYSPTSKRHIGH